MTTTADTWQRAYDANTAAVVAHPAFHQLLLAVAAWEALSDTTPRRLRMNSPTYGSWWHRQANGQGGDGRRAGSRDRKRKRMLGFAKLIARDVMPEYYPESEAEAFAFSTALQYVRARQLP